MDTQNHILIIEVLVVALIIALIVALIDPFKKGNLLKLFRSLQ